ncbi:MAG: flagellar FlbD family protein [Actinomycetota bacterium]
MVQTSVDSPKATRDGAVISLTRLSGQRFALNPDLMERIEATPDTVVSLVDGTKHVVIEDVDQVVALVRHFRASVVALAQHMEVQPASVGPDPGSAPAPGLRLVTRSGGE